MSVKYRLVKKRNLGTDQGSVPEKLYAQPVYGDLVSFDEILKEIAEAGIPTNQVKGVADRMNHLFEKHLAAGRRVQFGELGNFRYGVGSAGVATAEEFDVSMIRTPKIVFSPGSSLRRAKRNTVFEKYVAPAEKPATPDSGGEEEEERPGGL